MPPDVLAAGQCAKPQSTCMYWLQGNVLNCNQYAYIRMHIKYYYYKYTVRHITTEVVKV